MLAVHSEKAHVVINQNKNGNKFIKDFNFLIVDQGARPKSESMAQRSPIK